MYYFEVKEDITTNSLFVNVIEMEEWIVTNQKESEMLFPIDKDLPDKIEDVAKGIRY